MSRVRVCYVINSFMVGGAETVALDLARKIDPGRYDVTVLAPLAPRNDSGAPEMERRFGNAGVHTVKLGIRSWRDPRSLWRMFRFLKQERFQVIHGHNRFSDAWAVRIGSWAGIPHRFWTRHLVYRDMTPAQCRRYARLSRQADLVLAVSDAVRENCIHVEGIAPGKVRTVVNGIDTDRFAPATPATVADKRSELGLADDEFLLLYVARLNVQKAPEGFAKLIWHLREKGVPVRGFMCGTGPLAGRMERLIARGPGGVTLLGVRNDIPALLGTADLFVSTSRNEGLPLNVMEAMAAGAPFVGPAIDQISCLLEGTVLERECLYAVPSEADPVPDETVSRWGAHVEDLLGDPERRRRLGAEGRRIIQQRYSLERMIREHEQIYESFLSGDSGRVP